MIIIRLLLIFLLLVSGTVSLYAEEDLSALLISAPDSYLIDHRVKSWLPSGHYIGTLLDNSANFSIMHQVEGGGMARIEDIRFSTYGQSWTQNRWSINGLRIDNPFYPGTPLLQPIWITWDAVRLSPLNLLEISTGGNVDFIINPKDYPNLMKLHVAGAFPVMGASWMAKGLFDREPAFDWGVPKESQRHINSSMDLQYLIHWNTANNQHHFMISLGYYQIDREMYGYELAKKPYLSQETGEIIDFNFYYQFQITPDISLALWDLFESKYRTALGIENWQQDKTITQRIKANHLGSTLSLENDYGQWVIGLAFNLMNDDRKPNQKLDIPRSFIFLLEETTLRKAFDPGNIQTYSYQVSLSWKDSFSFFNLEVGLDCNVDHILFDPLIPGQKDQWFRQNHLTGFQRIPLYFIDYEEIHPLNDSIVKSRIWLTNKSRFDWFEVSALVGALYNTAINTSGEAVLHWVNPIGRLNTTIYLLEDQIQLSTGYSHIVEDLTYYPVLFLDQEAPSGYRYEWNDDGDLIAEEGEEGELLNRTGGAYHRLGEQTNQPCIEEIYARTEFRILQMLRINIQGVMRWFRNQLTVRFPIEIENQFVFHPEIPGIQPPYYERDDSTGGNEIYYLVNENRGLGRHMGLEVQFVFSGEWWFANLQLMAYLTEGYTAYGNGPDYNDFGIISEKTAFPNYRIKNFARLDSDRAYGITFIGGVEVVEGLVIGTTLRYRDGEPFGEDFSLYYLEGAEKVMLVGRDKNRYTFALNWDIRIQYSFNIERLYLQLSLDVFNVLGSATEIAETGYIDEYRTTRIAIDTVPPRSGQIKLEIFF